MAKPIRATPELFSQDAKRFIQMMFKKENSKITKKEIDLAKNITRFTI